MAVVIYSSADASAPTLNNGASSLQDTIKTILVDGYGAKPAAGWTQPFSGTNKRVVKQGAGPSGTIQYHLRLGWNGSQVTSNAYETMSDVDTGTNTFAGTLRDGCNTAAAHKWYCAADARTFYFWYETVTASAAYVGLNFGDIYAYGAADIYRCMSGPTDNLLSLHYAANQGTLARSFAGELARSRDGTTKPNGVLTRTVGDSSVGNSGSNQIGFLGILPYPNPAGNQIWIAPLYVMECITPPTDNGSVNVRGKLRGLWHWMHPVASIADRDTFSGTGDLAGKTFEILKGPGGPTQVLVIETSNTWLTNT